MHQPLTIADEEGVRFIDSEIIHRLRRLDRLHIFDCAIAALNVPHLLADVQMSSLGEKKAVKGVFITTSNFTREALSYAERTSKPIILIDGQKLAQLMIEFNIGVTVRKAYVVKRVDEAYFDQELG